MPEQMIMPQGQLQDMQMQMPEQGMAPAMDPTEIGAGQVAGQEMIQSEGVPIDVQVQKITELLQSNPEEGQAVMQKIQASGLDMKEIELLGIMASSAMESPDKYEMILGGIVAMFPELMDGLTGDISQDGESLYNFIVAAVANDGGVI